MIEVLDNAQKLSADDVKKVEILQNKLEGKLRSKEGDTKTVLTAISNQGNALEDLITPIGITNTSVNPMTFSANGTVKMNIETNAGIKEYNLHPNAITQLGTKLGIKGGFIKDVAYSGEPWQRQVAAEVLQKFGDNTSRQRLLLRSVGNEVRGVLSDKYKRFNTPQVFGSFFKAAAGKGAIVSHAVMTDLKYFAEVVVPEVVPVVTDNGVEVMVFGATISNSDFGAGSLMLKAYTMKVVCMNGMTRENVLQKRHLGKRLSDDIQWSERTYQLDSAAQASEVEDVINHVLGRERMIKEVSDIQKASGVKIEGENVARILESTALSKDDIGLVERKLIERNPEDGIPSGDLSLWTISNAITAVGRDAGGEKQQDLGELVNNLWASFKI